MFSDRDAIHRSLEAIFASPDFAAAPKMRALLRYLVDATLEGDAERLKGYAIGVDVFDRGAGFDPATDPIVRVQAGRLRKLLDAYYRTVGKDDAIRIAIPKGGYAVQFVDSVPEDEVDNEGEQDADADGDTVSSVDAAPDGGVRRLGWHLPKGRRAVAAGVAVAVLAAASVWSVVVGPATAPEPVVAVQPKDAITVAVLPFTNMSPEASRLAFADGLTDALTTALARVKSISIASRTSAFQYRDAKDLRVVGKELGVRYVIEGGLQHDGVRMRVNVQLVDTWTGAHLWAQTYDREGADELAVQSDLVTSLAAELRPRLFNAAKRALKDDPVQTATAWQLFLQSTWIPGEARNSLAWEQERVALARRALEIDPDLGQAHSVLADKLAYLATVDPPSDREDALVEASRHARRALELAPADPDAVFNVSVYNWHAGRIATSVEALHRTLELDPNHVLARFLVKAVPFTCSKPPRALIEELVAFDAQISPDNPVRWVTLYWIGGLFLQAGDPMAAADAAKRSAQIFRTPNTVFLLAAILVQLGDKDGAAEELTQQRQNWPNLDPSHYAEIVIPRRCGAIDEGALRLQGFYRSLAEAVQTARADGQAK